MAMEIEFSDLAINSWLQDLDYTLSKFGRKTAVKNEAAMEERLNFIRKYPEAGHIELVRAKKTYRSFQIRNTPLKIIYSITQKVMTKSSSKIFGTAISREKIWKGILNNYQKHLIATCDV